MLTPKQNAMIFILSKGSTDKKSSPSWVMLSVLLFLMPVSKSKVAYHLGGELGSWWKLMELGKARQKSVWNMSTYDKRCDGGKPGSPQKSTVVERNQAVSSCGKSWNPLFLSKKKHPHPQHQTSHFFYSEFICWLIHSHLKSLKSLKILWWFLQLPSESPSQSSQSPFRSQQKALFHGDATIQPDMIKAY